jgi:predicted small integral membrane protein
MYVLGCKLSGFWLCGGDFGITAVDDITIGITCTAFFHIAHISFASSWHLFCLSVIVLVG